MITIYFANASFSITKKVFCVPVTNGHDWESKVKQYKKFQFSETATVSDTIKPRSYRPNGHLDHVGKAALFHNGPRLHSTNGRNVLS